MSGKNAPPYADCGQDMGAGASSRKWRSRLYRIVWRHARLAVWTVIAINKAETWEKPVITDTDRDWRFLLASVGFFA